MCVLVWVDRVAWLVGWAGWDMRDGEVGGEGGWCIFFIFYMEMRGEGDGEGWFLGVGEAGCVGYYRFVWVFEEGRLMELWRGEVDGVMEGGGKGGGGKDMGGCVLIMYRGNGDGGVEMRRRR